MNKKQRMEAEHQQFMDSLCDDMQRASRNTGVGAICVCGRCAHYHPEAGMEIPDAEIIVEEMKRMAGEENGWSIN